VRTLNDPVTSVLLSGVRRSPDEVQLFLYKFQNTNLVVKKANEYGAVEVWMNERVRRACSKSCADFVNGFREVQLPTFLFTKYLIGISACISACWVYGRYWFPVSEIDILLLMHCILCCRTWEEERRSFGLSGGTRVMLL
jgi:hypothetical protein